MLHFSHTSVREKPRHPTSNDQFIKPLVTKLYKRSHLWQCLFTFHFTLYSPHKLHGHRDRDRSSKQGCSSSQMWTYLIVNIKSRVPTPLTRLNSLPFRDILTSIPYQFCIKFCVQSSDINIV